MITEKDLQEAIAECQGQRSPNASTCMKLAAFYIIRREMFGQQDIPSYSNAPPPEEPEQYVKYDGSSEFAGIVHGMRSDRAWSIMDELMELLQAINPRLYNGVLQKLEEG